MGGATALALFVALAAAAGGAKECELVGLATKSGVGAYVRISPGSPSSQNATFSVLATDKAAGA